MLKKTLALVCIALLITLALTGCNKEENNTEIVPTEAPTTTTTTKADKTTKTAKIDDPEGRRVGTLDKFLTNSRSFTIDEKVLRFYLDDSQMQYAGFKLVDPTSLEAIEPGEKIKNVKYVSSNGLTAYVNVKNRGNEVFGYKKTNQVKFYSIRLIKGNSNTQLHLPNKLGWNNTIDDYKKSYGKPLSETTDEKGNTILKYGEDIAELSEGYTLTLIFSDKGLTEFTIELHKV